MLLQNFSGFNLECGVDEAGRGCLAGPVTAAAVILPKKFKNYNIKDSKKLNWKSRKELANFIKKNCVAYSIKNINSKKIEPSKIFIQRTMLSVVSLSATNYPYKKINK